MWTVVLALCWMLSHLPTRPAFSSPLGSLVPHSRPGSWTQFLISVTLGHLLFCPFCSPHSQHGHPLFWTRTHWPNSSPASALTLAQLNPAPTSSCNHRPLSVSEKPHALRAGFTSFFYSMITVVSHLAEYFLTTQSPCGQRLEPDGERDLGCPCSCQSGQSPWLVFFRENMQQKAFSLQQPLGSWTMHVKPVICHQAASWLKERSDMVRQDRRNKDRRKQGES